METAQTIQSSAAPAKKGISGSTIKLIAIIAMLIDHIGATILERMLMNRGFGLVYGNDDMLSNWFQQGTNAILFIFYIGMRLIGRFGFPIFCFLLVEGFLHTHSCAKYALRLFLFALISEIPFDLAFMGKVVYIGYQNVFFTLFIGLIALWAFDTIANRLRGGVPAVLFRIGGYLLPSLYAAVVLTNLTFNTIFVEFQDVLSNPYYLVGIFWIILALVTVLIVHLYGKKRGSQRSRVLCADLTVLTIAMLLADLLQTDYSGMGVLTICIMYACRRSKVKEMLAGCIVLTVMSFMEITSFLMLIPIAKYNGKRGLNIKYFFYAFYPVHLALLYLICRLMGIA